MNTLFLSQSDGIPKPATRRLKVCVIASTYPRHSDDYAVPWLRESVRQFTMLGHDISVLAPSYEGLTDHSIDGVPVTRFRYSPKRWERLTHEQGAPNRIRNPFYQLLAAPYVLLGCRAARQLARREQFDIIHVHWPFPHEPMGTAAKSVCGAPVVVTCHGAEFALARRKRWIRMCLKRSLQKADAIIANSTDTAARVTELSGRTPLILPFGSTVEPKSPFVPYVPNELPRVLFTGRLIQRKGVDYLLRAIPHVLKSLPARFIITGDGDQRSRLEAISRELGIEDHVEFLGFVDHDRLNDEYARCDLWVNPSIIDDRGDTEGLGVGSLEAYAHGKPVVCSNVGGIPDAVIHQQTGLLVPEKQPLQLAEAIVSILSDPAMARNMAAAGLEFARQQFNWPGITRKLEQAYLDLLSPSESSVSLPEVAPEFACQLTR